MPKNIVILSDGTGKEGGKGHNTNVYKLFNMAEDRTPNQIVFYDRGLGTKGLRRFLGLAFGVGISKNIRECYEFIFDNYQIDDQIFLMGFSRGAFTIRSLSGFINLFGILPKSRRELIKNAYNIYKIKKQKKRKKKVEKFLAKHHTVECPIKTIAVWDTVGALGVPIKILNILNPFKYKFHDTNLCENVKYGFHALAIDDKRRVFRPVFWDERNVLDSQKVEQVWFTGMHSDVGGGYHEQELSDIAMEWMLKKTTTLGLLISKDHSVKIKPGADGKMHNSRSGIGILYRKAKRSLSAKIKKLILHQSVLDRYHNKDNKYDPWILKEKHKFATEPW